MHVRSVEHLEPERSWKRLLWWARRRMEVPDRLPFEVVDRLSDGSPTLAVEQHLQQPLIVMATKGAGTVRPFVRLRVIDLLLYQSLVDQLAEIVEGALGGRDKIFAYRQNVDLDEENQFEGSPTWRDFNGEARRRLENEPDAFSVKADISGYFMQVAPDELEVSLLERGARGAIARDLGELLHLWGRLGVRGLPQGLPASSPLGNFYLIPIDDRLESAGIEFIRYVDDIWLFADSFSGSRRAQDVLERELYRLGLSLSGEKTTPSRRATALERVQSAEEIVEAHQELFREGWVAMLAEQYADEDEMPAEADIDAAAVLDLYGDLVSELRDGKYPEGFRPLLKSIYRELAAARNPAIIAEVPELLTRFPDLTHDAALYIGYSAVNDEARAVGAIGALLEPGRFHREQEILEICRAALFVPPRVLEPVSPAFAELARSDPHPLVRARALLAWGAHSGAEDFSVAEIFWENAGTPWRIYPFVAIQDKAEGARDGRYADWGTWGRPLARLGESIKRRRFSWRRI